jgi:flavin-dependent dehydrogenase
MPAGVRELEALGVRGLLSPEDCAPIEGIRYLQEDGSQVEGRLASPGGLGIRRLALVRALQAGALREGARLEPGCRVEAVARGPSGVRVRTGGGEVEAQLLVAADGLASPLRRAHGLDGPLATLRRFGLRQHFALAPWSRLVEVHFAPGVEAYVTPAGASRVGVAFLWEDGRVEGRVSFPALLERFPRLQERLLGAPADSTPRGAGPLLRAVRARVADRLVLVGDAAGYVDALTGEGLTLALRSAALLGALLPDALARGGTRDALLSYERAAGAEFRRYALFAHVMLAMARRPRLRTQLVRLLAALPAAFGAVVRFAIQ